MKTFAWTVPEPTHPHFGEKHSLQIPDVRTRLRHPLWITSAAIFILALLMLLGQSSGGAGVLFILPFTFGPMVVSLLLGAAAASRRSLITLLISNILYFGWFLWVYISAFHLHPDPQAGIAFLFVGIYSLPVMIPLWIIAMCLRQSKRTKSEQ